MYNCPNTKHIGSIKFISGEASEEALTGTGSHGSDRMRNRFPRFFLTIVVVQNVSLCMTDMATGSDRVRMPGFSPATFKISVSCFSST